ncbi:hypothetical protein DAPPUDRAFT_109928 [Daphnia pulex]|uniref:Uncharacterized protein n=1 Tax=Daphnia pulex TaxID=6669 RepID=E9H4M0_DAPPU|nr:hypothetical protein DAPPUDRAFT_109928 [Daphnia pulex]|eukprot:EFX73165.1 hypothetical protein DAPPUDRAFT_109928 [Daphnia pulex]
MKKPTASLHALHYFWRRWATTTTTTSPPRRPSSSTKTWLSGDEPGGRRIDGVANQPKHSCSKGKQSLCLSFQLRQEVENDQKGTSWLLPPLLIKIQPEKSQSVVVPGAHIQWRGRQMGASKVGRQSDTDSL